MLLVGPIIQELMQPETTAEFRSWKRACCGYIDKWEERQATPLFPTHTHS